MGETLKTAITSHQTKNRPLLPINIKESQKINHSPGQSTTAAGQI